MTYPFIAIFTGCLSRLFWVPRFSNVYLPLKKASSMNWEEKMWTILEVSRWVVPCYMSCMLVIKYFNGLNLQFCITIWMNLKMVLKWTIITGDSGNADKNQDESNDQSDSSEEEQSTHGNEAAACDFLMLRQSKTLTSRWAQYPIGHNWCMKEKKTKQEKTLTYRWAQYPTGHNWCMKEKKKKPNSTAYEQRTLTTHCWKSANQSAKPKVTSLTP